jgi:hypothetical protein
MTERQRNALEWNNSVELQAMLGVKKYGKKLHANGFYSVGIDGFKAIEKYMIEQNKNSKTITFEELVTVIKNYRK